MSILGVLLKTERTPEGVQHGGPATAWTDSLSSAD